jgi:hypothetical protein
MPETNWDETLSVAQTLLEARGSFFETDGTPALRQLNSAQQMELVRAWKAIPRDTAAGKGTARLVFLGAELEYRWRHQPSLL